MEQKQREKLLEARAWIQKELDTCINFWLKNGMDREHGGVYTCLDRKGEIYSTDKSVWMQGRCGWSFLFSVRFCGIVFGGIFFRRSGFFFQPAAELGKHRLNKQAPQEHHAGGRKERRKEITDTQQADFCCQQDKHYRTGKIADGKLQGSEAAGKGFYMEINSGWYQPAFFFGAGCTLTYDTDDTGAFKACNIDYASDAGVAALKAMIALAKSPAFHNGSSIGNATNVAAIVDGTWDSSAAKELFGENYACAKLPTVEINGTPVQMSGFGGFKLLGVKPQIEDEKLDLCDKLALFLSSGEAQLARFKAAGWGPSNLAAKADEAVQADAALAALGEQLAFDIPQGQYPGDYWSLATALGDSVIAGEFDSLDDAGLLAQLQTFQDTCIGYAK